MSAGTVSVDEFQALEHKVLQTVELIRNERQARAAAEAERDSARAETERLREELEQMGERSRGTQHELESLHRDREAVRSRVERMLAQMDELL